MSNLRTSISAAIILTLGCAAFECDAGTGFDSNYDAAMSRAKKRGKPLFALFTGSDWCIWCKRLEQEVFSQPEFLAVATNAYELAVVDFPQDKSRQAPSERSRNKTLAEKFKVNGFPTVLLIDANGQEMYRAGYERGGAKAWIESFQKGAATKPLRDKHLKPYEDELRTAVMAFMAEYAAIATSTEKSPDYKKMAAETKASAKKHLPALQSIRKRLAEEKMPSPLEEAKAEMLGNLAGMCERLESFAGKEISDIAAEFEEMDKAKRKIEEQAKNAGSEQGGDKATWLKDWCDNVRTNMNIETCASFREKHLRPFALAEMDPDGKATEAERRILNASIDHIWGVGGFKTFKDATKLIEILDRTAKKPFAAFVAALVQKKDVVEPTVEWLKAGTFSGEDLRSVFWMLRKNGNFGNGKMRDALEKAKVDEWLKLLWRICTERDAAWKARGGGWARDVTNDGWSGFEKHGNACKEAFNRAMELHPYPEPAYLYASLGPFDDKIFTQVTTTQADFTPFYSNYLWFNCFPRWCGSHDKMKTFAERCYETRRHDTMVPLFYAEAILKMVGDMDISVEKYFASHSDELDKIIEVSLPQIENTNALDAFRQYAGTFATLAYYLKGDYAKSAKTWRSFPHRTLPHGLWRIIDGLSNWWKTFDAISGRNSKEFQKLNSLYIAGDYAEFLNGLEALRRNGVKLDKGETTYAEQMELSARMKTDLPDGKAIVATFPKNKTNWLTYGGSWRMNGTYAYYGGKYKSGDPLEWTVTTPGDFRIECEIAPNGKNKAWHFEFQFKPVDPALANRSDLPYLSLKFEDGKCNIAFGKWRDIYKNDCAEKATVDYAGGSTQLVVEYKAGRASIFLGGSKAPVLATEAHADLLKQISEGFVRFNGSGARLLSMKVMRPTE